MKKFYKALNLFFGVVICFSATSASACTTRGSSVAGVGEIDGANRFEEAGNGKNGATIEALLGNVANPSLVFSEWLPQGLTVVIDAGHGGIDGGVTGIKTGVKESDLNLSVAKKMQDLFRAAGFSVVMTRMSEDGLYGSTNSGFKLRDMKERRRIVDASSPTMVISVHMNFFPPGGRQGGQTFYQTGSAFGEGLARALQSELNLLGARDYSALAGDYYLLRGLSVPACIMECGFLSDAEEERLLASEEYQSKVAYAAFKGAISYLFSIAQQ